MALLACSVAAVAGDQWSSDRRKRRSSMGVSPMHSPLSGGRGTAALRHRLWPRWKPALVVAAATLLSALLWAACGGGGGSVVHNPGTQAGTYSLTVSGTVASGSNTLAHNITVKVTVN